MYNEKRLFISGSTWMIFLLDTTWMNNIILTKEHFSKKKNEIISFLGTIHSSIILPRQSQYDKPAVSPYFFYYAEKSDVPSKNTKKLENIMDISPEKNYIIDFQKGKIVEKREYQFEIDYNLLINLQDNDSLQLCLKISTKYQDLVKIKSLKEGDREYLLILLKDFIFQCFDLKGMLLNLEWIIESYYFGEEIKDTSSFDIMNCYKTAGFKYMNAFLRGSKVPFDLDEVYNSLYDLKHINVESSETKEKKVMKLLQISTGELNRILFLSPKLRGPLNIYRGTSFYGEMKSPSNMFLSTSLNISVAKRFNIEEDEKPGHFYKIKLPTGFPCLTLDIFNLGIHKTEFEVLLPYGLTFTCKQSKECVSSENKHYKKGINIECIDDVKLMVQEQETLMEGSLTFLKTTADDSKEDKMNSSPTKKKEITDIKPYSLVTYSIPLLAVTAGISTLYKWWKNRAKTTTPQKNLNTPRITLEQKSSQKLLRDVKRSVVIKKSEKKLQRKPQKEMITKKSILKAKLQSTIAGYSSHVKDKSKAKLLF